MKDIIGYEGFYKVTNVGEIYSIRSDKFLKLNYKKNGYVYVELNANGIAKTHRVHRLVAETFIPNYDNKSIVHHKNNNKSDNRVVNLEWTTVSENTKRAYDDGLIVPPNKREYLLSVDGEIPIRAKDYLELKKLTGYSNSQIANYIKDKSPLKKGLFEGYTIISSKL